MKLKYKVTIAGKKFKNVSAKKLSKLLNKHAK